VAFRVEGVPEAAGLALFGVRTTPGTVNVTIEANPGWTVMLGRINAIISGRRTPIIPTPEWNFQTIWPTRSEGVLMTSEPVEAASEEKVAAMGSIATCAGSAHPKGARNRVAV
jgi:hypothetical protein